LFKEYKTTSLTERLTLIKSVANFFQEVDKNSGRKILALRRAPKNFFLLEKDLEKNDIKNLGHYGTNIVENYFGLLRSKQVKKGFDIISQIIFRDMSLCCLLI
jgi:hypothetical protein